MNTYNIRTDHPAREDESASTTPPPFPRKQSDNIAGSYDENSKNGYPVYPAGDDIYVKGIKAENIDPEDTAHKKRPIEEETESKNNEKDFDEDVSGDDLDVPGTELDDDLESIGSEDEENNYYSLGDNDEDDDLDEYQGQ